MAIRTSGYFNNPAFSQAASNLASLFAPPSGADAAGWAAARERDAQAAKVQAEMRRAEERRRYVDDPAFDQTRFDRLGVADGTYAPNQSYYSVDQTNATSRANNAADNAGSLARQYAEPIILGEGQTAVLPAQTQKATSLGQLYGGGVKLNQGQSYFAPSAGAVPEPRLSDLFVKPSQAASAGPAPTAPRSVAPGRPGSVTGDDATAAVLRFMQEREAQPTQGAAGQPGPSAQPAQPMYRGDPKPLTRDEMTAQVLSVLAPAEQRAAALGSTPVQEVVTPQGPRIAWQADSIGQEPVIKGRTAFDPAIGSKNDAVQNNIVVQDIDRALSGIGESPRLTTGIGAQVTGGIAGTPAANTRNLLQGIQANISFDQLQAMRQASPTGGALGNVSDTDLRLLQSVYGSLEQSQDEGQLTANLKRLKNVYLDIVHGSGNGPPREALDAAQSGASASSVPAAGGASPAQIDPRAAQMLRANPGAAAQFDEIFGAGAAQRVLGGQ